MTEAGFHLKHHLTSFQIMILGFAGVILLGALVLMLPISAAGGGGRRFTKRCLPPPPPSA